MQDEKTVRALRRLGARRHPLILVMAGHGPMGHEAAARSGFLSELVSAAPGRVTDASDTKAAALEMMQKGTDLILFAGGDGTARDIFDVVGERVPLLGIPAGVKMQSAVFSLPSLTPNRTLDQIEALGTYGLDNPAYTLEFTTSAGKTHEIEVGGQNPGGAAYYVRVDDSNDVYLIPSYVLDPFFEFLVTPPYIEPSPTPSATAEPTEPSS